MARPTKYDEQTVPRTLEYIEGGYMQCGDVIPTKEGLSDWLDLALSTIDAWEKDTERPEFSGALAKLQQRQKRLLLNGGLKSEMNSVITKLVLHNHGFSDKQDTNLGGSVEMVKITKTIIDPKQDGA